MQAACDHDSGDSAGVKVISSCQQTRYYTEGQHKLLVTMIRVTVQVLNRQQLSAD